MLFQIIKKNKKKKAKKKLVKREQHIKKVYTFALF